MAEFLPPSLPVQTRPTAGLAIASLILGISSLGIGCFTGLPAVICGHLARRAIAQSNGSLQGKGMALAGLVLGYFSIVATVVVVAVMLLGGYLALATGQNAEKVSKEVNATATMNGLKINLEFYKDSAGAYPTTAQGLKALVTRPTEEPAPQEWAQVLSELPIDPWGNGYFYEFPGRKNLGGFDLFCAGPDGEPQTGDDIWPK